MELTELDEAKMKVLKEIADSNVILAGLKAEMQQMEVAKKNFFELRQNQLEGKLWEFLNNSKDLVAQTEQNYTHVHNFYEELKKFAKEAAEHREQVANLVKDFTNQTIDANNVIMRKMEDLSRIKLGISQDFQAIEQEKNFIRSQREQMDKEKIIFANKQRELNVALTALRKK